MQLLNNKTAFFLLLLSFFFKTTFAQSWFQLTDYPGEERDDGASFVIGTKAYCGSGVVPFRVLGDFYSFDLQTEKWDTIASLPHGIERQYASGFSYNGLGYLFGGYDGSFLNDLWQYDPQTDSWTQLDSLPSFGRSGMSCFVIDSFAYIIGGKTVGIEALDEVWTYNLNSGVWTRKNNLPFGAVWRASAVSDDQRAYLAFGLDDSLNRLSSLYRYEPNLDSWTKLSDFPEGGRHYVNMHLLGDQLIMIGGEDTLGKMISSAWRYNLSVNQWEELDSLPAEGRRGGMSFQTANAVFYTTGLLNSRKRTVQTWKLEDPTELFEFEQEGEGIQIFPNPTNGIINIHFQDYTKQILLEIFSLDGRKLRSIDLESAVNQIDIAQLHQDTLIFRIWNGNKWISRKVFLFM